MTRAPVYLIAFCAMAAGCIRQGDEPSPQAASFASLEKSGRWVEAASGHRAEALRLGPDRGDEHVKAAMVAYLMADQIPEAERFAAEVLARNPSRPDVLFYLGDGERVMQEHEAARKALERLLELSPDHVKGAISLLHVLLRLGEAEKALGLADRIARAPSLSPEQRAWIEIDAARALRRLGRKLESAERLARLLETEPFHLLAIADAAQVFAQLGKQDLAKGQRELHAWLSERGHQVSGDDETRLYSTGPSSPEEAARIALQSADRRHFLRAIFELERLQAAPRPPGAVSLAFAQLWLRLERPVEALQVVQAAKSSGGASAGLLRVEISANRSLGRLDEWRAALRSLSSLLAAEIGTASAGDETTLKDSALDAQVRAALLELEPGGDLEKARELAGRAMQLAPESWRPYFIAGRIALEGSGAAKAQELFDAAKSKLRPEVAAPVELRRWNAVASGLKGNLRGAARELMASIRESPEDIDAFLAFERVFGPKRSEPEVDRVLAMKAALEARLERQRALSGELAAAPFRATGPLYIAMGKQRFEAGNLEGALDCWMLQSSLEPSNIEGLRAALQALTAPRDLFIKLGALRLILDRSRDEPSALEAIARVYLDTGIRLADAEALAVRLTEVRPGSGSDALLSKARELRRPR